MNQQPTMLPPAPDSPRAIVARSQPDDGGAHIKPATLVAAEQALLKPNSMSLYRPQLPIYGMRGAEVLSYWFFADCEVMRLHPAVRLPLIYCMGPMHYAEWVVNANSRAVAIFAAKMLQWIWNNAWPYIQAEGYTYGWSANEWIYTERDGNLILDDTLVFAPRDAIPLVDPDRPGRRVGIRITGIAGEGTDLWAFRKNVPNKGFWYTHQPRYGLHYGQSQIRPSWRYWRRLAGVDGVEEIEDMATYKHGVGVTKVRHPNDTERAEQSALPQYAVNGMVHTRDIARFMAQNARSGSAISLSSENWPSLNGGGPKWDFTVETFNCNIAQLGEHDDRLTRRSSAAIGVPSELYEAAQTGSGYSGRAIPLQGFLVSQQTNLVHATREFLRQVILPLAKWNYGHRSWVDVVPKPLTETVRKSSWETPGPSDPGSMVPSPPMSQGVTLPGQEGPTGDGHPDTGSATPGPAIQMSRTPQGEFVAYRDPSTMTTEELRQALSKLE